MEEYRSEMVLYLIDLKDYKREQRLKKKFLFLIVPSDDCDLPVVESRKTVREDSIEAIWDRLM